MPEEFVEAGLSSRSIQRLRPALGTLCAVSATGPAGAIEAAVSAAFAELQQVECCMHPTRPGSDLQRLRVATNDRVAVDHRTWQVLRLAQRLHASSEGVFDPTLPELPGQLAELDLHAPLEVGVRNPIAIDLGGIAKGFAVDGAIHALRAAGCIAGLVNAGGDLRVFGTMAETVSIRLAGCAPFSVTVYEQALAVSDTRAADRPHEFRGYAAGRTDRPLHRPHAVVKAPTAVLADALTKCALFCTEAQREALFTDWQATLEGCIQGRN